MNPPPLCFYTCTHPVDRQIHMYWHHTEHPGTYLPPEDWEGLTTGLAYKTGTPWAGGRVCRVSRTGGKSEGSSTGPKPWLLASDGPSTHDFIQQTTAWSPHGRGPCLTFTHKHTPSLQSSVLTRTSLMLQMLTASLTALIHLVTTETTHT